MRPTSKLAPKARLLAGAAPASLLLAVFASSAYGQETETQQPEATRDVVTVTGFRSSLAQALQAKREENGVVDAIVAEDIADFPDLNLAEAIQRLPGIAIDRDAGEGRTISVRGLSSDFTRVRINGLEGLSVTGGTDSSGGANRSRSFDFNTFAAELFNSIRVRKSQAASIDEGSLGATVDLQTARPFDYDGFTYAASVQGGYNDLSEEFNPRGAFLISNQNDSGTFGWLFSAAYSDRSILEEGHSTVRWQNANSFQTCALGGATCSTDQRNTLNNAFHPRIPRFGRLVHDQERIGLTGSVQFRPTDRTEINVDGLFSRYSATRSEQFLEEFALSRGNSSTPERIGKARVDVRDYEIDANNSILYLAADDMDVYVESRFDELETDFTQLSVEASHEFTDRFRINGMAGASQSDFNNPVQSTILFTNWDSDGFSYDYRQNSRVPLINWGFDVTNPSKFVMTEYRDRPNAVLNTFRTYQFNAEYDLTPLLTLSAGVSYKAVGFKVSEARRDRSLSPSQWIPVTAEMSTYVEGFGDGLGMPAGNVTRWLVPDLPAVARMVDLYNQPLVRRDQDVRGVNEENTGGYVQADFDTEIGGLPVRGDVGVRYVETETRARGILSGREVEVINSYSDTLPAFNLAVEPTDEIVVRFGAAKVMSRPTLASLTPGGSISATNYTVTYGNPLLEPFRATNFDVSFEYYMSNEGLFAVAAFYKDIESFVARGTIDLPFSQTGLPASAVAPGLPLSNDLAAGLDPIVTVTRNINGEGGSLQGVELQYQQPFTFLPAPFDRFGFVGNYTWVDSEVDYGAAGTNQLRGLSPTSYNATVYYEHEKLSVRFSANGRDAYLTQFPGRNGNDEEGKNETFNLDFSARYDVSDNLQVTFEAINLTDQFNEQYVDASNRISVYHHTGREFMIGARYRY